MSKGENHAEDDATQPEENIRRRLQLDFSEKAYKTLSELKLKADVKTNAEVVRNALRLYEWFLEQKEQKAKIHVVKGDVAKEVELIF
jgi:hypothetical protein